MRFEIHVVCSDRLQTFQFLVENVLAISLGVRKNPARGLLCGLLCGILCLLGHVRRSKLRGQRIPPPETPPETQQKMETVRALPAFRADWPSGLAIQIPKTPFWFSAVNATVCKGNPKTADGRRQIGKKTKFPRATLIRHIDLMLKESEEWYQGYKSSGYFPLIAKRIGYYKALNNALKRFRTIVVRNAEAEVSAARIIQRQFRESISNPRYKMCKNRLLREFESMA